MLKKSSEYHRGSPAGYIKWNKRMLYLKSMVKEIYHPVCVEGEQVENIEEIWDTEKEQT